MTDLLTRLSQRPLAPDPKLNGPYFDYLQRKCLEFDRELALDALAALTDAGTWDQHNSAVSTARTILATLRTTQIKESGR